MPFSSKHLLALFVLSTCLSSCRDRTLPSVASTGPTAPAAQEKVPPALQRVRGNALMGKDGYGITLCGEQTQRIIGLSGQAKTLLERYLAGGAREFFIDGWAAPSAGTGVALQRIERIYSEGPGCKQAPDDFLLVARGNEPFWSLSVDRVGLTLERPDQPPVTVAGASLTAAGGERRLEANTSAGALRLVVSASPCSDGMSDTLYAGTATLTVGTLSFAGCAFAGGAASAD